MDSVIPIAAGAIDLWLAPYNEATDERLHSRYRALLNAQETAQEPRFYFARDRLRYLVTRALVRTVLSRYVAVSPVDWIFSTNAYGRPEIANEQARDSQISFNLSHTHSLIVLGVTRGRALGVDVENIRAREAPLDIADRFFAPAEVAALALTPLDQRQDRFYEYWTLKESYIKARGMGLSLPLHKFSFHYPTDRSIDIAIHPDLADDPARWLFWQFQPTPEYLAAICAEKNDDRHPILTIRQTVPLKYEQTLATQFLRTSVPCS